MQYAQNVAYNFRMFAIPQTSIQEAQIKNSSILVGKGLREPSQEAVEMQS